MPTVVPPKYVKQVMVLLEPEVSGEIYAWAEQFGLSASAMMRELISAGLKARRPVWEADAKAVSPVRVAELQIAHGAQGGAQVDRRRDYDADRRKPATA